MTTNKNLAQPAYNSGSWNLPMNGNFGNIDLAFGGLQYFNFNSVSGSITLTGTFVGAYPANSASYIPLGWNITGAPSGNINIVIPAGVSGRWLVYNSSNYSPYYITVQSGSGTAYVISPGLNDIYCDGSNIFSLANTVGDIKCSASNVSPQGWLLCYGQTVPIVSYPFLAAAIGPYFPSGGGNFTLPDLRGRVIAGLDNMGGSGAGRLAGYSSIGSAGGEQTHTLVTGEVGSHTHTINDPTHLHLITVENHAHSITDQIHNHSDAGHAHTGGFAASGNNIAGVPGVNGQPVNTGTGFANIQPAYTGINTTNSYQPSAYSASVATGISISANADASGHNNVQPTIGLNFWIKY